MSHGWCRIVHSALRTLDLDFSPSWDGSRLDCIAARPLVAAVEDLLVLGQIIGSERVDRPDTLPDFSRGDCLLFSSETLREEQFIINAFALLGHCMQTLVRCFELGQFVPADEEVQSLVRTVVMGLEADRRTFEETVPKIRADVGRFFAWHLLPARVARGAGAAWRTNSVPYTIRRFALHQVLLYWWALDQDTKDKIHSVGRFKRRKLIDPAFERDMMFQTGRELCAAYHELRSELPRKRSELRKEKDFPSLLTPVTTFHSVKGGTGKTTLALAHALHLADPPDKNEQKRKVAIIDLDLNNPSFIHMGLMADLLNENEDKGGVAYVEEVLTARTDEEALSLCRLAFRESDFFASGRIVLGTVLGIGDFRSRLLSMLDGRSFERFKRNFRIMIVYLFRELGCEHVVIDNSPGLSELPMYVAGFAVGIRGLFLLVATGDIMDVGNLPQHQIAYSRLFSAENARIVLNKAEAGDPEDARSLFLEAWQIALARAGYRLLGADNNYGNHTPSGHEFRMNVKAMFQEREEWKVINVEDVPGLRGFWAKWPVHPDVGGLRTFEQLEKFGEKLGGLGWSEFPRGSAATDEVTDTPGDV